MLLFFCQMFMMRVCVCVCVCVCCLLALFSALCMFNMEKRYRNKIIIITGHTRAMQESLVHNLCQMLGGGRQGQVLSCERGLYGPC